MNPLKLHLSGALLCLGVVLAPLLITAGHSRAQEQADAGDIEIIRAFQERYYYSTGSYVSWGVRQNGAPGSPWPTEGDYSQSTLDSHIGSFIWDYLKRYNSDTFRPLLYLSDDHVAGGRNWGDVQSKIIRIPETSVPVTLAEKRRIIVDVLRRQRILATPLVVSNSQQKRTDMLYGFSGGPTNMAQATARYESTPWAPTSHYGALWWTFLASPSWTFHTRIDVTKCTFGVRTNLSGLPFVAVLQMTALQQSATNPDYNSLIAALDAKGVYLSPNQGFFKYQSQDFDPGNLFAVCPVGCDLTAGINTTFRNLATDGFSFALVYPSFNYLTSSSDNCCGTCEEVALNSVHVRISLGKTRLGAAHASLSVDSPHVSSDLWHPRTLQAQAVPGFTAVRDAAGVMQQMYGQAVIAHVTLRVSADGYEVAIYDRPSGRLPDPVTGLISVGGLNPVKTHKFINPQAGPGPWQPGMCQLRYEKVHGTETDVSTFNSEVLAGNGSPLTSLTHPGGHRKESVRTAWEVNASNQRLNVDTETRHTYDAAGSITGNEARTYRWGANGRVLDKVVIDPDGAALTTRYTYATDDPEQVSQVVRPDGSWDQYTYDAIRRITKHRSGRLDTPLTCMDAECRVETTSWPSVMGSGITRVITTHAGVEVARRYRQDLSDGFKDVTCTVAGAAITAPTNLVTTTKWYASGWFQRRPRIVTAPDGTTTKYTYTVSPANAEPADADTLTTVVESGAANVAGDTVVDGTRTTRVINREGNVIMEATEDIVSAEMLASRFAAASVDAHGRPVTWSHSDGSQEILNYDCCGLTSRTDRQGVTTNYTRDRIVSRPPAAGGAAINGVESSTWQNVSYVDAAAAPRSGNLHYIQRDEGLASRTYRRGADGTLAETALTLRDLAGRVILSRDATGNVTASSQTYVAQGPSPGEGQPDTRPRHLVRTTTLPNGGTRIEEYYQDGSLKGVTGTAVHGQRYEYGAEVAGTWTKVILLFDNGADSGEWSMSWSDLAGRPWKTLTSAGAVSTRYFNSKGQLWKTVDPDGVTILSEYDNRGRLERTVLDVNRNGITDLDGPDRISETLTAVSTRNGAPTHLTLTKVWATAGNNPAEVTRTEALTIGMESWTTAAGLTAHSFQTLPVAGGWAETTAHPDNTQSVRTFTGGRLASAAMKDTAGATLSSSTYQYDAHGRIHSVTDPLGGATTYTYYDDDKVLTVTSPDPDDPGPFTSQVTSYTYTPSGLTDVVTLPDGRTTDSDYFPTGELQLSTGTAAPPAAYTYDYAGRAKTLTTHPGTAAAAVTTWNYFNDSGRLQSKVHAGGSGTEHYTWTAAGRALTHSNARGTVTGAFYGSATSGTISGAGDLTDITYTDATSPVTYFYDRLGRINIASTGTGPTAIVRGVQLTLHGQQVSEDWGSGPLGGVSVNIAYDALRRRESLSAGGPEHSFAYDALTGELSAITTAGPGPFGTATAHYSYRPGTRQVSRLDFRTWYNVLTLTQQRSYDNLHRLTGVSSHGIGWSGVPGTLSATYYELDTANRRTRTTLGDGTWWKYTYDNYGQVTEAERRLRSGAVPAASDAVLPGQEFGYEYDARGNRTSATRGGHGVALAALTFGAANQANQYPSVTHNRTALATGMVDENAWVEVNDYEAVRAGPWWAYSETAAGSNATLLDFNIYAGLYGTSDQARATLLLPPATVTPLYDADGNLTDDGLRTFTWDAENRLTSVTTKDDLLPAGAPLYRVTYQYDDLSRRIAQTVEARISPQGVWILVQRRAFLFDGWQCVAEFDYSVESDTATRTLYRSQVWGQDTAGGAGGLLMVRRHTGPQAGLHFAVSDGNGNVTALWDTLLLHESAHYDYDPFGNLLRASGPFAAENPYLFSSQFTDDITGLLYYGYRHYDPVHGRWLSRDPIGEAGGVNLYGFVGNDGVNHIDVLGLAPSLGELLPDYANTWHKYSIARLKLERVAERLCDHDSVILPVVQDAILAADEFFAARLELEHDSTDYLIGEAFLWPSENETFAAMGGLPKHLPGLVPSGNYLAVLQGFQSRANKEQSRQIDNAHMGLAVAEVTAQVGMIAGVGAGGLGALQAAAKGTLGRYLAKVGVSVLAGIGGSQASYYGSKVLGADETTAQTLQLAGGVATGIFASAYTLPSRFVRAPLNKPSQPAPNWRGNNTEETPPGSFGGKAGAGAANELSRVIGRTADLATPGAIRAGERLLDFHVARQANGTINQRATWYNNHRALRAAMREARPIRDLSPDNKLGKFLNGERMQLEYRGWTKQSIDGEAWWLPPTP